ncbi:uncharacterized protein LOC108111599 isoform X1 [Drosophila eugracilis]|uniref:uncharacterized protein LOC108111599 isoform X1 n=1 Tax=Drosophila eugracilis TaxID=29029 RepID=UPI001BD9213E|nr:uncharacterized protein LOC108111599 isoform X1 [Drosophila eugracilis]
MKSLVSLGMLLCLALSQVSASCPETCPDTEDVVWAVGPFCSVFRNQCYFEQAKCKNSELTVTTQFDCQQNCATICAAVYQPTSGIYKGQVRNFSNECNKQAHSCLTGESGIRKRGSPPTWFTKNLL